MRLARSSSKKASPFPPPVVSTRAVSEITEASATFSGTIDPQGQQGLQYYFQYSTNSGLDGSTPLQTLDSANEQTVTFRVHSLTPNQPYTVRLVVVANALPYMGVFRAFSTFPAPTVTVAPPSTIQATSAGLSGTVDPQGLDGVTYHFQYRPTANQTWLQTPTTAITGSSNLPVAASITGLNPMTGYQTRVLVKTADSEYTSAIQSFTTFFIGQLFQPPGIAGCVQETGGSDGCATARALGEVTNVVVSPDGKYAYSAALGSVPSGGAVAVFARDSVTGQLTQLAGAQGCVSELASEGCALGRSLNRASDITISPDGKNVYVASMGNSGSGGAVAVFARDQATGVLTQLPGTQGCVSESGSDSCAVGRGLAYLSELTVSPDGKNLYVAATYATNTDSGAVAIFARDPATGAITQLAGTAGCVEELGQPDEGCAFGRGLRNASSVAVSPDGKNVYVGALYTNSLTPSGAVAIFERDTATGQLTQSAGAAGCMQQTGGTEGCMSTRATRRSLRSLPQPLDSTQRRPDSSAIAIFGPAS